VIVRILGDRLYQVPEGDLPAIESLDADLGTAMAGGDEATFSAALDALIKKIRGACEPLADDDDRKSDLVVPHEGASLQEVRDMLDAGV
jgi:hypothetical protein